MEYRGKLMAAGMRFGIIVARFNDFITKGLLAGALDTLIQHGTDDNNITVAWVPGAFEIPLIAHQMAVSGKYDAVICLGTVIRGDTSHFEYVCGPTASGIAKVSQESGIPVMFGVLTTETIEQSIERSGCKAGNKGSDVALAAIELVDLIRQINSDTSKKQRDLKKNR